MSLLKLDDRDLKILAVLSKNGRISKTDLAREVNLSPTPLMARLARLEEDGVISGYGAQVAVEKLAAHVTVFVVAELEDHRAPTFGAFEKALTDMPNVTQCWALGGGVDYLFQVVARDINAYQRLMDGLLERNVGLSRYFTYIVTKTVKQGSALPLDVLMAGARSD